MKDMLKCDIDASYGKVDVEYVLNEAEANAFRAFQGSLASLAIMEKMKKDSIALREKDFNALTKSQEEVTRLTSDLSDAHLERDALKSSMVALETKLSQAEDYVKQLATNAGDITTYYSQERAKEMMEEFQEGKHTSWNAEECRKQLEADFPDGAPGTSLLDIYSSMMNEEA